MKKIILSFLLILTVSFLTGCSNNDAFDKKQECGKYKDKIQKEIHDTYDKYGTITEIFFSPSRNSCIYVMDDLYTGIKVVDYLTSETLFDTLNQYCGMVNGKIEFGKTKDKEPFNKVYKEYDIEIKDIIGTDKCEDKIKDKYEKGLKLLKGE